MHASTQTFLETVINVNLETGVSASSGKVVRANPATAGLALPNLAARPAEKLYPRRLRA
jgi:hypothetical protein